MANKLRNELTVVFAGKKRTLRATIECITTIEAETGKGIIALIRDMGASEFRVNTLVSVIFHGLKGAGDDVSVEEVAQAVIAMGIINAYGIAIDFLNVVMGEPGAEVGKPLEAAS